MRERRTGEIEGDQAADAERPDGDWRSSTTGSTREQHSPASDTMQARAGRPSALCRRHHASWVEPAANGRHERHLARLDRPTASPSTIGVAEVPIRPVGRVEAKAAPIGREKDDHGESAKAETGASSSDDGVPRRSLERDGSKALTMVETAKPGNRSLVVEGQPSGTNSDHRHMTRVRRWAVRARDARAGLGRCEQAALALVVFGVLLRAIQYFGATSQWLDEILLSTNILRLPMATLVFGRLDMAQSAPIGFLIVEKLLVSVLGSGDAVLRIVPFLSSVTGLVAFFVLARACAARHSGSHRGGFGRCCCTAHRVRRTGQAVLIGRRHRPAAPDPRSQHQGPRSGPTGDALHDPGRSELLVLPGRCHLHRRHRSGGPLAATYTAPRGSTIVPHDAHRRHGVASLSRRSHRCRLGEVDGREQELPA